VDSEVVADSVASVASAGVVAEAVVVQGGASDMATMTLDQLVTQLRTAYGSSLRSVVLYGSAAGGEHIPKRSDYNVLVITDSLPTEKLRAAAAVGAAWTEGGSPPPMTLTLEEWRASSDIFAMEYADILERHRILDGEAPFEGIRVAPRDLRLQVEREAMGKLLQFRQGVLAAGNDGRRQLALLEASLSTLMTIFRAVVRLGGERPAADNEALATAVATRAGFDPAPFTRVVRHVRGTEKVGPREAEALLAGYLTGLERLVAYVDKLTVA
jgi:predicted nucleotidyltransferase